MSTQTTVSTPTAIVYTHTVSKHAMLVRVRVQKCDFRSNWFSRQCRHDLIILILCVKSFYFIYYQLETIT